MVVIFIRINNCFNSDVLTLNGLTEGNLGQNIKIKKKNIVYSMQYFLLSINENNSFTKTRKFCSFNHTRYILASNFYLLLTPRIISFEDIKHIKCKDILSKQGCYLFLCRVSLESTFSVMKLHNIHTSSIYLSNTWNQFFLWAHDLNFSEICNEHISRPSS